MVDKWRNENGGDLVYEGRKVTVEKVSHNLLGPNTALTLQAEGISNPIKVDIVSTVGRDRVTDSSADFVTKGKVGENIYFFS